MEELFFPDSLNANLPDYVTFRLNVNVEEDLIGTI